MIARTWRGFTTAADAEAYLEYLHRTGLAEYRATVGNRGVMALRRVRGERAEFLLLTLWESPEAVQRFAGAEPCRAVFYPEDARYLVEADEHVDHFEVVYDVGPPNGGGGAPPAGGGTPRSGGSDGPGPAPGPLARLVRWWSRVAAPVAQGCFRVAPPTAGSLLP